MTLSGTQIQIALAVAGIPTEVMDEPSDGQYRLPLSQWLLEEYHQWFLNVVMPAFGIQAYVPESGDCDDFTDLFNAFARIIHRRDSGNAGFALPVGRLNLLLNPDGKTDEERKKHACVWAYTRDRGLIFIEPQVKGQVYDFTRLQLGSATRCSD